MELRCDEVLELLSRLAFDINLRRYGKVVTLTATLTLNKFAGAVDGEVEAVVTIFIHEDFHSAAAMLGKGLYSSTFQFNPRRFDPSLKPPSVSVSHDVI